MKRIVIVGGGISGLAAANRITETDPDVQVMLLEADRQLGGVLQTTCKEGYLIERGADMFTIREQWAIDLCRRIGFEDQLIETDERFRRAFIVHRGRLAQLPDGFTLMQPTRLWPFLTTPLLSWRGKLRAGWEFFVPSRVEREDESLANFARRRLGLEAYERIVQPLVGGIYTADPEQLSMRAALPQFLEMERKHGGLIRSALKSRPPTGRESGARYGTFRAPRDGMASFVAALAARLPGEVVQLGRPATALQQLPQRRWQLRVGESGKLVECDGLLLAVPAQRAAQLLDSTSPDLAGSLKQIPYAGAAVVALGYRQDQIAHTLDGFGCVAPLCEQRKVLSISFSSIKFAGRAPPGRVLFRVFIGGACQPELLELDDERLQQIAQEEMSALLGAAGRPELCEITRWKQAMPQYHLRHLQRVEAVDKHLATLPNLRLAGNAFDGVGIPLCIRRSEQAADSLLAEMRST